MNKILAAERELFEEQIKADNSFSNLEFDWDKFSSEYGDPHTQELYLVWKLARNAMGTVAQDILDARRHRYMRITTKKIRSGDASLECTPEQYDAAIDLALSRDPTLGNGITEREIEELSTNAKMVDCQQGSAMGDSSKNTIVARKTYGKVVTEEVRNEAIKKGQQCSITELRATGLNYIKSRRAIELNLADGTAIILPIEKYGELASLSDDMLSQLVLGFGGHALCLDQQDLHISIEGLVEAILPETVRVNNEEANELANAIKELISKASLASDVCDTKIMDEAIDRLKQAVNYPAIQKTVENSYCYPECSMTYQAMELNEQKRELVEQIAQHFDSFNPSVATEIRKIFKK